MPITVAQATVEAFRCRLDDAAHRVVVLLRHS